MPDIKVSSPRAELLLTSAGPVTEAMKERALEMGRLAGSKSPVKVLCVTDGWEPFGANDSVGIFQKKENAFENRLAKWWSGKYLRWVLGKRALIHSVSMDGQNAEQANFLLSHADMLVVPGGNTYQTMRGLNAHEILIKGAVAQGLPYVGESAGSIVAGHTLKPASLEPADICPDEGLINSRGLGFVKADIVVHAKGAKGGFDIDCLGAGVTKFALDIYASDASKYESSPGVPGLVVLNDKQALAVRNGQAELI